MAKRKRFSEEEIINKLREAEILLGQGSLMPDVCRKLAVSQQTFYKWRKKFGGLEVSQAKKLRELEKENARLKRLVADQTQSGKVSGTDIDQLFGEYVEELLEQDKAHLFKLPKTPPRRSPHKPKIARKFAAQVTSLLNKRTLKHNHEALEEESEETVKKRDLGKRIERITGDYQAELARWTEHKKATLEQADETSLYRWDAEQSLIYFLTRPNKGKPITDYNPYVNLVDIEEFDADAEMFPYFEVPKTWGKDLYVRYFSPMHKEVVGKADEYLSQITIDKKRMTQEAEGKRIPKVTRKKEKDLHKLRDEIRDYAASLGFPAMGVTKLDRRYTAENMERALPYDTLIILAHEMPSEQVKKIPTSNPLVAFTSYRDGGHNVHKVADFIRSRGYRCMTRVSSDGAIKYPPHAVNAGMGNYSTFGICIVPEVGTRTKMVGILIDAELPIDRPRDCNIEEFCSRCRCCQKVCPAGAIPKDEKRIRGAMKRQTHHLRCFEYMATHYECMLCVRICPFSVVGYERCMKALPRHYEYNLHRDKVDMQLLRSSWKPVESRHG